MRKKGTTMQDVARAAGVSQPTVSMILNGKLSNFPASTVESVLAAASALQYNFRGTSVATGDTVLVIATQLTNPFYTAIIQAMDRYAAKRDIRVTAACTYHDPELESDYLTTDIKQHYLGVVFLYPPDNQEVYASHGARIPIVTVCDRRNRQGDIVELYEYLNFFRLHMGSVTQKGKADKRALFEDIDVVKYIMDSVLHMSSYKIGLRRGLLWRKIKNSHLPEPAMRQCRERLSVELHGSKRDYWRLSLNRYLRYVCPWLCTLERDRAYKGV